MQKNIKEVDTTPRFMFAVVNDDTAGQTIQLFKTKKQAEEYLKAMK